jgi:hypothetical protein
VLPRHDVSHADVVVALVLLVLIVGGWN